MPRVYLPKGTRDLLPAQMNLRLRGIERIRAVFARFGFEPLETPAFERIETLMGKYGDEGDRLIYKVLKRGEGGRRGEADLALRYDLTVPLARVVAMHPNLAMPFKRSQIQPVWRADRPQRGRFREFYQCDVDTVGTDSPLADAECLAVVDASLSALGFSDFTIRLNDRRLLRALAQAIGAGQHEHEMLVALDKLDRVGRDGVAAELSASGFTADQIRRLFDLLEGDAVPGAEEIEEHLAHLRELAGALGVPEERITLDRTLARGLDYYTGPVFETVVNEGGVGSVSGGGRYDELIGMFAGRRIPAVGVSLGLERLFVVMEERGMLGETTTTTRVWVTVFDSERLPASLTAVTAFRRAGVPAEVSLDREKLGKQLKTASRRGVPFAVVIGPDEAAAEVVRLKDLRTGAQVTLRLDEAIARVVADR